MTKDEIAALDPGIRAIVQWLRAHNFHTTDSGDGVSKVDLIASGDALAAPHVFMSVSIDHMESEARRLLNLLTKSFITVRPGQITASYDPVDMSCVLALYDVNDTDLE